MVQKNKTYWVETVLHILNLDLFQASNVQCDPLVMSRSGRELPPPAGHTITGVNNGVTQPVCHLNYLT